MKNSNSELISPNCGHPSYKIDRQHDIDHILTKILPWLEGTRPKLEKASGSSEKLRDPCGKKGQKNLLLFLERLLEISLKISCRNRFFIIVYLLKNQSHEKYD